MLQTNKREKQSRKIFKSQEKFTYKHTVSLQFFDMKKYIITTLFCHKIALFRIFFSWKVIYDLIIMIYKWMNHHLLQINQFALNTFVFRGWWAGQRYFRKRVAAGLLSVAAQTRESSSRLLSPVQKNEKPLSRWEKARVTRRIRSEKIQWLKVNPFEMRK